MTDREKAIELREALVALVHKLDEINNNSSYKGIWAFAQVHGCGYSGPEYSVELDKARTVIQNIRVHRESA